MKIYSDFYEGVKTILGEDFKIYRPFSGGSIFGEIYPIESNSEKFVLKTLETYKNSKNGAIEFLQSFNQTFEKLSTYYSDIILKFSGNFIFKDGFGYNVGIIQKQIEELLDYINEENRSLIKQSFTKFTLNGLDQIQTAFNNGFNLIPDIQLKNVGLYQKNGNFKIKIFDTYPAIGKINASIIETFVKSAINLELMLDEESVTKKVQKLKEKHIK